MYHGLWVNWGILAGLIWVMLELIDKLVDIAEADKDHASRDFLFWFVREQVEEESTAKEIVDQLKNYGECHYAIMDHRLGKR